MEIAKNPATWSEKQWIAFLLLAAVDADGKRHPREMRYLEVHVGGEVLKSVSGFMASISKEEQSKILKESLSVFLKSQSERERIQKLLVRIFMADGEYGLEEQAMTKKIGDWIRGEAEKK